jgi:hypothetical protein
MDIKGICELLGIATDDVLLIDWLQRAIRLPDAKPTLLVDRELADQRQSVEPVAAIE